MRRLPSGLHITLAAGLFALVVADLSSEFDKLSIFPILALLALGLLLAVSALSSRRVVAFVLLAGATAGLMTRLALYERLLYRSPEDWKQEQRAMAERVAKLATERFVRLCRDGHDTARSLARSTELAMAVEGSDAQDDLPAAFELLSRAALPRALDEAVSGATLYDTWRRPMAWTGDNLSWEALFQRVETFPEAQTAILKQGVFTYLIIIEPLASRLGFVTVEIPLVAQRRIDNRFLHDYDAISAWAGRSVSTEFVELGSTAIEPAEANLDWQGDETSPSLSFALRAPQGELLGISTVAGEVPTTARLEARRRARTLAAVLLSLAVVIAMVFVGRFVSRRQLPRRSWSRLATLLGAFWGARLTLLLTKVPLGFGVDLDNPAHYASSLLFGLLRSPIDFLLTALALFGTAAATWFILLRSHDVGRPFSLISPLFIKIVAAISSLLVLLGANHIVYDVWHNSKLALSTLGASPEPSLFAVQLGLVLLFATAALLVGGLYTLAEMTTDARSPVLRDLAIDVVLLALAAFVAPSLRIYVAASVVPLLGSHLLAIYFRNVGKFVSGRPYTRFAVGLLVSLAAVLAFYPSIVWFEDVSTREFIEAAAAPAILRHGDSELSVINETARSIDRLEAEGRLESLRRDELAYELWASSDLAASALSSSVEVRDSQDRLVSRFALNFPRDEIVQRPTVSPAPFDWIIEEEPVIGEPSRPAIRLVRRSIQTPDGERWEIQVRLVVAWTNLPFIPARDPYIDLFRAPGMQLSLLHRELELFVFDDDGRPLFQSIEAALFLDQELVRSSRRSPHWVDIRLEGKAYAAFVFSEDKDIFALCFPRRAAKQYAIEIVGWAILATAGALVGFVFLVAFFSPSGSAALRPARIWHAVGESFYGKLYVAFVLLALVPIVSLAFFVRSVIVQQLQDEIEQDGRARAQVAARFVNDFLIFEKRDQNEGGIAAVSDSLLEWVAFLVAADVDLYSRGELIATSKQELFASGLLSTRAVPSAYRDVVLSRQPHSIHLESVGAFDYIVVSVPVSVEPWREPGILALPLASRGREIARRVSTLNQTVLLAALGFSLAAAALANALARRIAGPINTLTDATRRIAKGDFDVALEKESDDEIGDLFAGFTQMTSDLKRQREDLERTKKLEAWAEMARQVAHEVKNPLTPIQLSTEHLLRVYGDAKVDFKKVLKECTETIFQQVRTLRQISMEFSTFASPEPLKREPTDLNALLRDTVAPYERTPPNGVAVSLEIDDTLPTISADRRLLERTLINLMENALHALNGGGQLDVRGSRTSSNGTDWVQVSVSDDGVGIEPELRERIFEPYFSTRASGTGLGLAIARKVVEEHGGTIVLESEVGKGTTVSLRLPVDPGEEKG